MLLRRLSDPCKLMVIGYDAHLFSTFLSTENYSLMLTNVGWARVKRSKVSCYCLSNELIFGLFNVAECLLNKKKVSMKNWLTKEQMTVDYMNYYAIKLGTLLKVGNKL